MKRRLFTLVSVMVIFTMILPSGSIPARAQQISEPDNQDTITSLYRTNLPLVQRAFPDLPPILAPTAVELHDESTSQITSISEDGSIYTFDHTTSELDQVDVGDVIIGGVSETTPYGFLRKVTAMNDSGGDLILTTEQGKIEDAYEQLSINVEQVITPEHMQPFIETPGVTLISSPNGVSDFLFRFDLENVILFDEDGDPATTDDQIIVNGSLSISPTYVYRLLVKFFTVEDFYFSQTMSMTSELTVESRRSFVVPLIEKKLLPTPITLGIIPIPGTPIVLTPELQIYGGINGRLYKDITTTAIRTDCFTAGLHYYDNKWIPIASHYAETNYQVPPPDYGVAFTAYVGPRISIKVNRAINFYVKSDVGLKLEIEPLEDPLLSLEFGIAIPVGVSIEIFKFLLADYHVVVYDHWWLIYSIPNPDFNNAPYSPSSPIPPDGEIVQNIGLILSWTGGDPDGDTVTYDVYFEPEDSTPDILVSDDQSSTTYIPGILNNSLQYYWQIVAQDEHGSITYGPVWNFTIMLIGPGDRINIPAGTFQMGCDDEHNADYSCPSNELPLHTVTLDAYQIDATEVTNAQYAQCVSAEACTPPLFSYSATHSSYYGNSTYDNYPVIYVDWNQAKNYCTWAGGSLPTEAQWEKAARGSTDNRAFPWGDELPDCALSNFYNYYENPVLNAIYCQGDTITVGSYPSGASPYGLLDMSGNVYEWVNDWYSSTYYSTSPNENPTGPTSGTYKVIRGGSWFHYDTYQRVASRHDYWSLTYESNNLGFRCAYPPSR